MSTLKLFLLGSPRFERDGVPLQFDTRKNVALVAYLAVTGQTHSRESLITLLWPELEPSRARAGLRRNLSTLKKTLGEEWLVVDRETVGTDPDADLWLDVEEFRELARAWQAHGHPESELCPQCLPALAEAVELYQGDFLAGFTLPDSVTFDDWQFFQTEGLRQELAAALERLLRGHSALGAYQSAIPYARRWVALDLLHEPAHRELMRLYAQADQRAAALRQYAECERVLDEELGVQPDEETTRLFQLIRERRDLPPSAEVFALTTAQVAATAREPKHNLPVQPTPFVGREPVLAQIEEQLRDPECRLLTLVGPGGCGKTRLALEAAAAQLDDLDNGVFLVPLAQLQSVESIEPSVAAALGLPLSAGGDPQRQLLNYLREKSLLLILDGFERLLEGVGLATGILGAAPDVKILATSRIALRVRGEHLFHLGGLGFPDLETVRDAIEYDAVKLFVGRARRADQDFELQADDLRHVVRICSQVEGMPLAILLAAAWVEMLSPAEIADEIGKSLDFLETDLQDVPERQRSMRAVFDHSWNLLTERQCELFQALSVFQGGFTRQAAQRVTGASLRELKGLVDRSLLERTPVGRYAAHELLRQYAAEKLTRSPDAGEEVGDRHCAYFIAALEPRGADVASARRQEPPAELDLGVENARAAWDWAVDRAQVERLLRVPEALYGFYSARGRLQEGAVAFESATRRLAGMASPEALRARAAILGQLGVIQITFGDHERAAQLMREGLALLERLELANQDTRQERASLLGLLGSALVSTHPERAGRFFEQSRALSRAAGDRTSGPSLWLGVLPMSQGRYKEAERSHRELIAFRESMRPAIDTVGRRELAEVFYRSGQFERARPLLEEVLQNPDKMGDIPGLAHSRSVLGLVLMSLGHYQQARAQGQMSLSISRRADYRWIIGWSLGLLARLALVDASCSQDPNAGAPGQENGGPREGYAEAQRLAQESITYTDRLFFRYNLGIALAVLALASRGLGELDEARRHLIDALAIAAEIGVPMPLVHPLSGIALLLADAGEHERAVELCALASRYPFVGNSRWFEDVFGRHIDAIAATLPPEVAEAARERGRARDLKETVKELLVELSAWDSQQPESSRL